MLRSAFLSLLFLPSIFAHSYSISSSSDTSVDISTTVTQPDANTYCSSGVCLSINQVTTTTTGDAPTQSPSTPGTVTVQTPPTCDVCQAGMLIFYLEPSCCPDGSVCDIAGYLSSGSFSLPTDCGVTGNAAITFDACQCQFYCNDTLGHGGNPTAPPTLPATEAPTQAPTQPATEAPTYPPTEAPTQPPTQPATQAPTQPPTTVAPTQPATEAPTQPPTTQAPTQPATEAPTQPPTTIAPTQAPTQPATEAPTTKSPTTKAPTTSAPTRANNPTQPPATVAPTSTPCQRCNSTHVFFVVFPICCTNQIVSTCNNNQIASAAKHLPDNCDQTSITWDGCSCTFYCNATSAVVPVNVNQPGNAPVLPVPQNEVSFDTVDIHFNLTKPNNNTRCIAGTSICITVNGASNTQLMVFPFIGSLIVGMFSFL